MSGGKHPTTRTGRRLIRLLRPWAKAFPDGFLDGWEDHVIDVEREAAWMVHDALADLVAQCEHARDGQLMEFELAKANAVLDAIEGKAQ